MAFKNHWQLGEVRRMEEEATLKSKKAWKIHFQSFSNIGFYFIYYVVKYAAWFFGTYYLHNHNAVNANYWFLVFRNNL